MGENGRGDLGPIRAYDERVGRRIWMKRTTEIAIDSFLDGFTGAGLFGHLRRPGAPNEFVDSRSVQEIPDGKLDEAVHSPTVTSMQRLPSALKTMQEPRAEQKVAH
jgi:hypothetical protein